MASVSLRSLFVAGVVCSLVAGSLRAGIDSVTSLTAHPRRFARVDYTVMLTAPWKNPYDAREIVLDFELQAPSGKSLRVPAFYQAGVAGAPSQWGLRFTPVEAGGYTGRFVLRSAQGEERSRPLSFTVAPNADAGAHGFLHASTPWVFVQDDGTFFRGIGQNICWEARVRDDSRYFSALHENPRFNYEYLLGTLVASGGNYFRTWMCSWNLPLEWNKVDNGRRYVGSEESFNPSAIKRMDELVSLCDNLGLHMMLCIDTAGSYLGGEWDRNPYNVVNGGPAATQLDFFQSPEARARYKNRLRLLVARWGWSPSIGSWEFFNEIDNLMYGVTPRLPDALVVDWHREMADYVRSIDPYGHPVTTSVSHREVAGLNGISSIAFNQHHIYKRTNDIPEELSRFSRRFGKPHVIGEFGYEWDWSKDFNQFAGLMDRDYERGLWLGLFSETPILPMSWWWEFFDERRMTEKLARVRQVSDEMLSERGGGFEKLPCLVAQGEATALAVRCGSTVYVYVQTDADGKQTPRLTLPGLKDALPGVSVLNVTTGGWTAFGKGTVGKDFELPLLPLEEARWRVMKFKLQPDSKGMK